LLGNGPELLWTRNALERNGYTIDSNADIIITLIYVDNNLRWSVRMNDHEFICDSIRAVIDRL